MLTVDLESKTEEVWRWVLDESVGVIGIHGEGGVGKTTILKQIYHKLTVSPHCFDTVIWVTVSRSLSLEKVQDDIWKRIGVFNSEWVEKTPATKAEAICDTLSKREFVLLLDDLGEPLDLIKVGVVEALRWGGSKQMLQRYSPDLRNEIMLHYGNKFKLIFTTRFKEVCRKMGAQATLPIKSLEWEHAWELFKNMVGEDKLCDRKFLELAQLIARMCKGLPMLLRTVGRAMASKTTYDEWEAAIEGLNFQVAEKGGKVFVPFLLELCFKSLDRNSRSCLLSFSLFPEDFTIPKNELIDFWICQQVIGHGDSEECDDVLNLGYKIVDVLVGACLLEEDEINSVKLLDLIRDFALEVESRFTISKSNPLLRGTNMEVGWALSIRDSMRKMTMGSGSLFTFLLNHNPFVMLRGNGEHDTFPADEDEAGYKHNSVSLPFCSHEEILKHGMKFLTVLDLSNSGVEEIPRDIGDLVALEYLNLSHTWIEHLPFEIWKLFRLKCLNLEYNEMLRVVPKLLISGLLNLVVLKLFRCGFSVEEVRDNLLSATFMDIEPVLGLKHLEVLSISITCPFALQKLFSNHKLLIGTQSLSLEVFWGVKSLDISAVATMKNLLKLEIRQVEALKELNGLWHYIEFGRDKGFEKLREITVEKCSSLTELTWVALVANLKIFTVKDCEEIEEIVSMRRLGKDIEPFAKLEVLVLESLPKLESINGKALRFQQLKKMEVTDCYMLKKLPVNSTSAKANKVIIETEEDWWNDLEWEDDVAKGIFVPCFKHGDEF